MCIRDSSKAVSGLWGANGTGITTEKMQSWAFAYKMNGENMDGPFQYIEGKYPGFGTLAPADNWQVVGQGILDDLVTGITFTPDSALSLIHI